MLALSLNFLLRSRSSEHCNSRGLIDLDLFYTHGLGGSRQAQPEIEQVFAHLGYCVRRVPVPFHDSRAELLVRLATMTFGDLCLWIQAGADILLDLGRSCTDEEYVVIGDSLGGFISLVAAQREPRIGHCILLACSGDVCDAATRLHELGWVMHLLAGRFARAGKGGLGNQARRAAAGKSDFQREFELINTFRPERLERLRRLLILGDRGDPVAPEAACLHFAENIRDATVRMVYDEGRHHPIGRDALERYAVPFLHDRPVPASPHTIAEPKRTG